MCYTQKSMCKTESGKRDGLRYANRVTSPPFIATNLRHGGTIF